MTLIFFFFFSPAVIWPHCWLFGKFHGEDWHEGEETPTRFHFLFSLSADQTGWGKPAFSLLSFFVRLRHCCVHCRMSLPFFVLLNLCHTVLIVHLNVVIRINQICPNFAEYFVVLDQSLQVKWSRGKRCSQPSEGSYQKTRSKCWYPSCPDWLL